jgi:high affinity Mn2+ porin
MPKNDSCRRTTAPPLAAIRGVNWTVSLGMTVKGARWCRPRDTFGFAGILSGASALQQACLKVGGTGITDGDGNLSYDC